MGNKKKYYACPHCGNTLPLSSLWFIKPGYEIKCGHCGKSCVTENMQYNTFVPFGFASSAVPAQISLYYFKLGIWVSLGIGALSAVIFIYFLLLFIYLTVTFKKV